VPGQVESTRGAQKKSETIDAIVTDTEGQETSLQQLSWRGNIRRLGWLGDPQAADEEGRRGPLAIEIREPNSTTWTKGVLTLVPLRHIAAIEFDYQRQFVTYRIHGLQQVLTGTLQYRGINTFTLTGRTTGGQQRSYTAGLVDAKVPVIKRVIFPQASAIQRPRAGLLWNVKIGQPNAHDPIVPVRNLKPLFAFPDGRERLLESLPLRKADPLTFGAHLQRCEILANDPNNHYAAAELTVADGTERLVAIPLMLTEEGQTGLLQGLLGEIDAGWKLFPLHTIRVVTLAKRTVD
jgi:hypothetical protein